MIDRPHYLTAEEWGEACRLANNEAKPAERAPRKSPGNGIAAGGARAGFSVIWAMDHTASRVSSSAWCLKVRAAAHALTCAGS